MSFWQKLGLEDWRGIIAALMLVLTGILAYWDHIDLANVVFAGFMGVAATYFYSKGE